MKIMFYCADEVIQRFGVERLTDTEGCGMLCFKLKSSVLLCME